MATLITIQGADFSANSVGFIAPVTTGLLGWWWLGGSVAETRQDRAGIANATLSGSPTIAAGYVSFGGFSSGQYLTTNVTEVDAMTLLVVARSTEGAHSSTDLPMFVSNYGTDAGKGGVPIGASIYVSAGTVPAGTIRLGAGQNNNGTVQGQINTTFSTSTATSWNFYAGTLADTSEVTSTTGNARILYNMTTDQSNETSNYPRVSHSANKMRIGAGYSSSLSGSCDVAFAAFYSGVLTEAQITTIYDSVKARLAALHSITI